MLRVNDILLQCTMPWFPNLFDLRPPCLDTWDLATPSTDLYLDHDDYFEILLIISGILCWFSLLVLKRNYFLFLHLPQRPLFTASRPPGWETLHYAVFWPLFQNLKVKLCSICHGDATFYIVLHIRTIDNIYFKKIHQYFLPYLNSC